MSKNRKKILTRFFGMKYLQSNYSYRSLRQFWFQCTVPATPHLTLLRVSRQQ